MTIVPLTSLETHLYSPSELASNPLEIISVPEVVNSPRGIGGVQVYPLGAAGAILTEVSSKELILKPGTIKKFMTISLAKLLYFRTHIQHQVVLLMNYDYQVNY